MDREEAEKDNVFGGIPLEQFFFWDPRYSLHSRKTNMEPESGPLEEDIPFKKTHHFHHFPWSYNL